MWRSRTGAGPRRRRRRYARDHSAVPALSRLATQGAGERSGDRPRTWPSRTRALNLRLSRDRKAGGTPRGEAPAHVRDVTTRRLENACREARADPAGAIGHDQSARWELARAVTDVLVRDVDRSRSVARPPLRFFAHVEQHRSVVRAARSGASVELLDAQWLVPGSGFRRHVSTHVVEADHRKLRSQSLRLFGVDREHDDRRRERNDRADPHRERIVADNVECLSTVTSAEEMRRPRIDEGGSARRVAKERQR